MPRIPFWFFVILATLYFSAARVDIMDIDATQYAEISREMAQTGDYLHIYDRGNNYLDKPPFLFWASAASIDLLGANNLGYKLPSILLALLALFATYRLAKLLYDENTGRVAALILGTCQGVFLMTNDVRCDLSLMAWVITSIWLLQEWVTNKKNYYLLLGSIAIAMGMMTKGPIGIMAPAFALCSNWLMKRTWHHFFHPQYLIALIIIGIMLIPMCIGLYQQYDIHPQKFVDGKSGVSGLVFYFWTQSFGRITGENVWNNGADISFQLVNMLWSFLPWIFILLPALFLNIRNIIRQRFQLKADQEWLSTGGFILCYLAVGLSKYQLPHYIFVGFPLAAIICAQFLRETYSLGLYPRLTNALTKIMTVVGVLLFVGVLLILTLVFPASWYWLALCAVSLSIYFFVVLRKQLSGKIVWAGATAMLLINIFLTHHFYYQLMQYQVGNVVGKYIQAHHIPNQNVIAYRVHDPLNAMHFYANQVIPIKDEKGYLPSKVGDYILTQAEGKQELTERGYLLSLVFEGELFKVSELKPAFMRPATRKQATSTYYFCRITKLGDKLALH